MRKNMLNFIYLLPVPVSQAIRNFIIVFLMARYLPMSDVGLWGQIISVHAFLYLFLNLNLTHSITRYFPSLKEDVSRVSAEYWAVNITVASLVLIACMIMLPLRGVMSEFLFKDQKYEHLVVLLCIFIFLENMFNNTYSYLRAIQSFGLQSTAVIFRAFCELAIVAGGIVILGNKNKLNLESVFSLYFMSLALSIAFSYFLALRSGKLVFRKPDFAVIPKFLSFGVPQLPASTAQWVLTLMDRILITRFLGLEELGLYFIANRVGMVLQFPYGPYSTIVYTEASKKSDRGEDLRNYKKRALTLYLIGSAIAGIMLYLAMPIYLPFLLGKDSTHPVMPTLVSVIILSIFVSVFFNISSIFWSVDNQGKRIAIYYGILAAMNIGLNFILIPRLGILGAAVSSAIAYALVGIACFVQKEHGVASPRQSSSKERNT